MDVMECISTRRSIRRFLDIPVDQETMLSVVEAGTYAPSSGNVQDWRFIVVDDPDLRKKMAVYCLGQECVHNAAFLVVVCSDPAQTERHFGLRGEKLYTIQNCAACIQNMLLAAHALELGGVWVGAFDENKIKNMLGLPGGLRPQAVLAFGYPAEVPDHKVMIDLSLITFFNGYGGGARIKNIHRLFKDYHVDWERKIKQAHTAIDRAKVRTTELLRDSSRSIKSSSEAGGNVLKTYKDKLSEKIKHNRIIRPKKKS